MFPTNQQDQIRVTLSFCLQAVVSQTLLPRVGGGRILALEIMVCTPAVRALIRDGKTEQIYSMIQSGQKYGMKTLNQSLYELQKTGKISLQTAMEQTSNPDELNELITRNATTTLSYA